MTRTGMLLSSLAAVAVVLLCMNLSVMAQMDTDGDLNADSADPFPNNPDQGGVYAGAVIDYDVLMTGDLDATGWTGTVITISGNGVTFDGNGHKVIAPGAREGISVLSSNVTLTDVAIQTDATCLSLSRVSQCEVSKVTSVGPGYCGIVIGGGVNNTVDDCTVSGRQYGILMHSTSTGNVIKNNDVSGSTYGIANWSGVAGNSFISNNCSGSWIGLQVVSPAEVVGNLIANCQKTGLQLSSSSEAKIYHNNIHGNGRNVHSNLPVELSFNDEGNYWGRSCPDPPFVPGEDSNSQDVVDSHPYATPNGWLDGGWPGCSLAIVLDINPGGKEATINLRSKGVISAAILTTDDFDATTVDPLSVALGPDGAAEAHGRGHIEDVDGDGDLDLVLHFRVQDTGIQAGDTEVSLTGETTDGQVIAGTDAVRVVGGKAKKIVPEVPESFGLSQSIPNPANPSTQIAYQLPEGAQVRLVVYNVMGQPIRVLVQSHQAAGYYRVVWDGNDASGRTVASGVYLYLLEAGDNVAVRKMVLAR